MLAKAHTVNGELESVTLIYGDPLSLTGPIVEAGTNHVQKGEIPLNTPVTHEEWGRGLLVRREDDRVVVLFNAVGYKTLSLPLVREHHLLRGLQPRNLVALLLRASQRPPHRLHVLVLPNSGEPAETLDDPVG